MEQGIAFAAATFGRDLTYAVANDRIHIGAADRLEVDVYSPEGELVRSVRAPEVELRVTPEMEAVHRDTLYARVERAPEEQRANMARQLAHRALPDSLPACPSLTVDDEGNLWVREYPFWTRTDQRYLVFDSEGRVRTSVVLPSRLRVLSIRTGHIWPRGRR